MRALDLQYEVRTPRLYWAVAFLLGLAAAWGAWTVLLALLWGIPSPRLVLPIVLALTPLLYIVATREYQLV